MYFTVSTMLWDTSSNNSIKRVSLWHYGEGIHHMHDVRMHLENEN